MNKFCMLSTLITVLLLAHMSTGYSYEPPLQLKWSMKYDEVKKHLEQQLEKEKRLQVQELKVDKQLADGFKRAELKKVELLKKKATDAYAVFDPSDQLCAFYYIFRWTDDGEGKPVAKCWEYHQNLVEALTTKYGKPTSDESLNKRGERITTNVRYETVWDGVEDSSKIIVAFTRNLKKNIIGTLDDYYVFLIYQDKVGMQAEKAKQEAIEEL